MDPTTLGVIGPGFLNQVPTLRSGAQWFDDFVSGIRVLGFRGYGFRVLGFRGLGF